MLFPWFLIVFATLLLQSKAESLATRDLCPYTGFCTDEPLSIFNDLDTRPCCMQCSCSMDCNEFGNCCPEKSVGFLFPHAIPCRTQEEIYGNYLNRSFPATSREKLKVIDTCPEEAYTKSEFETAAHRCHNRKELDDLFFVSDKNDIIYLNRFCAECNGVTDFTTWKLVTPCYEMTQRTFSSFEELTDNLFSKCIIYSKPPTGFDFRHSICLVDRITQCNVTGMWDFYDQEIKRQCESYELPYALSINDAYANVHCFMCNNPKYTHIYSKCDLFEFTAFEYALDPFGMYTAIIDWRDASKFKQNQTVEEIHGCAYTEIFDPFMERCWGLVCPIGSLPSHGTCKSVFDVAGGHCLEAQFEIQAFPQQNTLLRTNAKNLGDGVKKLVRKVSESLDIACGISDVKIFESVTCKVFVSVRLFTTPTCEYIRLALLFGKLAKEDTLVVQIDGEQVSLPLLQAHTWNDVLTSYWTEVSGMCLPTLFTKHSVYCPSLEYNMTDILQNITSDLAAKLSKISVNIDENRYRICLDDYKKEINSIDSSGSDKVPFVKLIGFALSVCLVLLL